MHSAWLTCGRRFAEARALSAQERREQVGGVVGYTVRLDSKRSARTRLLFCTTGGRHITQSFPCARMRPAMPV